MRAGRLDYGPALPGRGERLRQASCKIVCLLGSALLLLEAAMCPPAAAEPAVAVDSSYYDVVGASLPELVAQMASLGPKDEKSSRRFWAYTRWFVRWRFTYRERDTSCSINGVKVSLEIKYVYPRWKNETSADERARQAWSRMMSAIEKHEQQHGQHGRDAAREVEDALGAIARRRTCDALGRDANALSRDIVKRHAARDVDYDRRTSHGRAEGVHLP
jgi:predicted secreted Zn-dependent protease